MESSPWIEEASAEYLGQWNRLVSTTNWEKGRIICLWRERLAASDAPQQAYTDEAWSRWVGGVSPQHVGRLRRVYQRFGETSQGYAGLFWSHFLAALDWPDAEMWLEGAVQGSWSVSQMRQQRWEATGSPAEQQPRDDEVPSSEYDEDVSPDEPQPVEAISDSTREVRDPERDEEYEEHESEDVFDAAPGESEEDQAEIAAAPVRPFANLAPLPPDLADGLERMKLAIVQHKLAQWSEVSCQQVLDALDGLKQLAVAP